MQERALKPWESQNLDVIESLPPKMWVMASLELADNAKNIA